MQLFLILSGFYFACEQKTNSQQTDSGLPESQEDSGAIPAPTSEPESQPSSEPASQPESEQQPSSEPTSETTNDPTSEPIDCSEEPNFKECFECLSQEYPAGYNVYASSVIEYCYCGVECEDDCTDFCATGTAAPSTTCESCVQTVSSIQTSQCITDLSNACLSDSDCVAFSTALGTCPPP